MLKGKELGDAIRVALQQNGKTPAEAARYFNVKPPSVSGWMSTGRISKDKFTQLVAWLEKTPLSHWGLKNFPQSGLNAYEQYFFDAAKHFGVSCRRLEFSDAGKLPTYFRDVDGNRTKRHIPDFVLTFTDNSTLYVDLKPADLAGGPDAEEVRQLSESHPEQFRCLFVSGQGSTFEIDEFFRGQLASKGVVHTPLPEGWGDFGDSDDRQSFEPKKSSHPDSIRSALKVVADAIATIELQSRSTLVPLLGALTIAPDSNDVIESIVRQIEAAPKRLEEQRSKHHAPAEKLHASRAA